MPIKSFFLFITDENSNIPELWFLNSTFKNLMVENHPIIDFFKNNIGIKENLIGKFIFKQSISKNDFNHYLENIKNALDAYELNIKLYYARQEGGEIYEI